MARQISKVLLLGHTGYIGSRLLHALNDRANISTEGRSIREFDLTSSGSAAALAALLDEQTALIVCAAIKKQLGDTPESFHSNVLIAMNVASAIEQARPAKVVFFSSAAVYGEDVAHDKITESTPVSPTSYYGISKFTCERLLLKSCEKVDVPLLVLRPALVYGPSEPDYYYSPSGFLRKVRSGETITLWGDGKELREFLFVNDVVEITKRVTLNGSAGVLNVVSGNSYSYCQALQDVEEILGCTANVEHRERTKEKVDHFFDSSALREAVPNFDFTPLKIALKIISEAN